MIARILRPGSVLVRGCTLRCSSVADSLSGSAASDSPRELDEFVDSIGRDVADMDKDSTFSSILRRSKMVQLGDFNGRLVAGRIVHRVQDDLYVDFGMKFNAVCKAPALNSDAYHEGADVLLRLHDPELSEQFLGSKYDLTLLEADAVIVRLVRPLGKGDSGAGKPLKALDEAGTANTISAPESSHTSTEQPQI